MDEIVIVVQPQVTAAIAVTPQVTTAIQAGLQGPAGVDKGITVIDAPVDVMMQAGKGYRVTKSSIAILTLPMTPQMGDVCAIFGYSASGWVLTLRSGEVVQVLGGPNSVAGPSGTLANLNRYDAVLFTNLGDVWLAEIFGGQI